MDLAAFADWKSATQQAGNLRHLMALPGRLTRFIETFNLFSVNVQLVFNTKKTEASPGASLFDIGEALGLRIPTSCNKQGRCKECLVEVTEGMEHLSSRAPEEKHLRDHFRLSCRCRVAEGSGLIRCHTLRRAELQIERQAFDLPGMAQEAKVEPAVTRDGDRVLLDGEEIARSTKTLHGLAIDLGTTTVVLRLLNLETGETVADASFENPQRFGGSDVMARIFYDTHDPAKLLQRTLVGYLGRAIQEFPVDASSIFEVVVAGNSTMRDLFFRLDVYSIGQNPYQSVTELEVAAGKRTSTSVTETAARLRLPVHPRARVYGLPIISGHVGADAAACLLAVDLAHEERLVALMDIGTNTELLLGNRHKLFAASCPAGPAFEGGKITCGMPGLTGAIERITLQTNGSVQYTTIGGGPAEGICGSGLVDLLGELVRTGRMNPLGRLEDGSERVNLDPRDTSLFLSESDINELAQAKGANAAGLRILFENYGVHFDDVAVFYLAGGFGRHLDTSAAKRIGLIPDLPDSKIVQVGNASIEGACRALLSKTARAELERMVGGITHCRLETHPQFFDYFVDGCQFQPIDCRPSHALIH